MPFGAKLKVKIFFKQVKHKTEHDQHNSSWKSKPDKLFICLIFSVKKTKILFISFVLLLGVGSGFVQFNLDMF